MTYFNKFVKEDFFFKKKHLPGNSTESELLESVCSSNSRYDFAPVISNNSDHVTVVFKTDSSIEHHGFSLRAVTSKEQFYYYLPQTKFGVR